MKRKLVLLLLIICLLIPTISLASNLSTPSSEFYVYDEANILTRDTKNYIISINKKLERKTGAQVVVAVVNSLQGKEIEEYAVELFRNWGIGDKEKNNGVLLLVSLGDKKMRIEVGYGLEGAITDSKAGRILDEYVIPEFKKDNYDTGIKNGFTAIVDFVSKEYKVEINGLKIDKEIETEEILEIIVIILIFIIGMFEIFLDSGSSSGSGSFRSFSSGSSRTFGGGGSSGGGGASRGW